MYLPFFSWYNYQAGYQWVSLYHVLKGLQIQNYHFKEKLIDTRETVGDEVLL